MRTTTSDVRYRNRSSGRKKPGVDRLSKLPDSLLVHILSFLPIEDAIKTEVLSKRWKSLWTYSPSLSFRQFSYYDDSDDEKSIYYDTDPEDSFDMAEEDFVALVDKTLVLSNSSKVDRLEFDFEYKPCLASKVNLWTRFAAVKGTEELRLVFHDDDEFDLNRNHYYELPQHVFTNSLFRELHISNCRVNPKGNVGWKSLKKLSIGKVSLSDELLEKMLSSCPVLEMLELYRYRGFSRLRVDNASLKKLILRSYNEEEDEADGEHDNGEEDDAEQGNEEEAVDGHDNEEDPEADGAHGAEEDAANGDNALEEDLADGENPAEEDEDDEGLGFEEDEGGGKQDPKGLEISAPHLQSLEICGHLPRNCQLVNVSSLVDAKLACRLKRNGGQEDFIRIQNELGGLLSSFAHVNSLTIGTWAMQELSSMEAKGLSSPLLNCTSLTLESWLDDDVFPWIATMLRLSPNLETLVMTKSSSGSYKDDRLGSYELQNYWTSQKRNFKCLSLHLKKVVFANSSWFSYISNFFYFVQFLLKNAKVLQKVIIHTSMLDDSMPKELYIAANKLLNFPRSSPDAVVLFCK